MLPPVWCASHVVGEKPPQAAWDRPWVPWEGCRPRRAFPATWLMPNRWHGGWLISHVAGHTLARHPIDQLQLHPIDQLLINQLQYLGGTIPSAF